MKVITIYMRVNKQNSVYTNVQKKPELQLHTSNSANNTISTDTRLSIPCFK